MNRQKEKKTGFGKRLRSIISLILIIAAVLVILANRNIIDISSITRYIFDFFSTGEKAEEFYFDAHDTNMYTAVDGGLAIASVNGLEYYDKFGDMVLKESFTMTAPVVTSNGKQGLLYDVEGSILRIFDSGGYILELNSEEPIISASLNKNGWLAVVTRASGYKGAVTVYSLSGGSMEEAYVWYSGAAYVLDAEVSPDNKHMAALSISENGSRVVLFSLKGEEEQGSYTISDSLIIDIEYLSDNSIAAFSENSALFLNGSAVLVGEHAFADLSLADYAVGGFAALVQSKYRHGNAGSIVTLDEKGEILGTLDISRQVLDIAVWGNYVAVLYPEGLTVYTKDMAEFAVFTEAAGAENVVMAADKSAIVTYTYSAEVISF